MKYYFFLSDGKSECIYYMFIFFYTSFEKWENFKFEFVE